MFFAILNAAFIYGLIWLFERKRRALHEFDFDMIAVVPPFVYLGLGLVVLLFGLGIWGSWAAVIVFIVVLFWMLWKKAKLSLARASAYSAAVVVFNLILNVALAYKTH
jgi:cbb3-type cytochrome oxidase subunit 3